MNSHPFSLLLLKVIGIKIIIKELFLFVLQT